MHDCELCRAIDPQTLDCSLQRHLAPQQKRVIASSQYGAAIPTIGAFVPGYLLIVPRRHVLSLGQLSGDELRDLEAFTHHVADRLRHTYGLPVLGFEYGLNAEGARRIGHGHLHLLPTTAGLGAYLDRQLPGHTVPDFTHLPPNSDASYVSVFHPTSSATTVYPVANDAQPRLRLREIVARLDPRVDDAAWDWQSHPHSRLIQDTVADLTSVLAGSAGAVR